MSERERKFPEPETVAEAAVRKRKLEHDIWNIERQLAEGVRVDRTGTPMAKKEYRRWRSRAHSSLIYMKSEQSFLKDWIKARRRAIEAGKVGIFDASDPRELLLKTRSALKKALSGDDAELGQIYNVIDQYLHHAA